MVLVVKTVAVAMPLMSVVVSCVSEPENVPEAPLPGAVKVTPTPAVGLPKLSTSNALNMIDKSVEMIPDCPAPAFTEIVAGAPAALISRMVELAPPLETVTLYWPDIWLAFRSAAGTVAVPVASVLTVYGVAALLIVTDYGVPGAVKVIGTPACVLPLAS